MPITGYKIEKMKSKRSRLAYGETNERRDRNDKRNKPPRKQFDWNDSPLAESKQANH